MDPSETSQWYAIADMPAGRLHVRVEWGGKVFHAFRDRASGWFDYRGGDIRPLPPKNSGWPDQPSRWQPINDAWTWPNGIQPKPLTSKPATVDGNGGGEVSVDHRRPWRDATNIRYEPRGSVSLTQCEWRLLRALAHCEAHKDRRDGGEHFVADLSLVTLTKTELANALARIADEQKRAWAWAFQPLPQDHADFLEAMSWWAALRPPAKGQNWRQVRALNRAQRVVLMRALDQPLSFADIGHAFGISDARCKQIYINAISACWRVANGGRAFRARATETEQWATQR